MPGRQGRESDAGWWPGGLGHERTGLLEQLQHAWTVVSTELTARVLLVCKAAEVVRDQTTKTLEYLVS